MDISLVRTVTSLAPSQQRQQRQVPSEVLSERRDVIKAANVINSNQAVGPQNELIVSFDRETQRAVTKIVDRKTREVVMQVPLESVLRLAQDLSEQ
jgi:uncharacterized FlaG/YvyC family protein